MVGESPVWVAKLKAWQDCDFPTRFQLMEGGFQMTFSLPCGSFNAKVDNTL